jgi:3-methyladenine DNA glycosylase AlkD
MTEEIINDLKGYSNKNKIPILCRFFKTNKGEYGEGDIFWGINLPSIRLLAKKYRDIDLAVVTKLIENRVHEIRMLALLILVYKYRKSNDYLREEIFLLYINNIKYINNWDLVDVSSPHIVGEYLLNKDKEILVVMSKSDNLWEKRISIISTFSFIRKNDYYYTLKIAKQLLDDKHDLIHKAVGWMLREIYKRDEKVIIRFLDEFANKMPRTALRYTIEKMPLEERAYYLHDKFKQSKLKLI